MTFYNRVVNSTTHAMRVAVLARHGRAKTHLVHCVCQLALSLIRGHTTMRPFTPTQLTQAERSPWRRTVAAIAGVLTSRGGFAWVPSGVKPVCPPRLIGSGLGTMGSQSTSHVREGKLD